MKLVFLLFVCGAFASVLDRLEELYLEAEVERAVLEGNCKDSSNICKKYKKKHCYNAAYVKQCMLTCDECVVINVFHWNPTDLGEYACQQITFKDCKLGTFEKKTKLLAYLKDEQILDDSENFGSVKIGACKKTAGHKIGFEQCREKYDNEYDDVDYNIAEIKDNGELVCSGLLDHFFDVHRGSFESNTQQLCCRNALYFRSNNMEGEPECNNVFDVESELSWFPFKF